MHLQPTFVGLSLSPINLLCPLTHYPYLGFPDTFCSLQSSLTLAPTFEAAIILGSNLQQS